LLKRPTYSILILVVALALPTAALGASAGSAPGTARIGLADAQRAANNPLTRPVASFHHTIAVGVRRIRADQRRERRERQESFATLPGGVSRSTLDAIASCESGGDPTSVSSDGTYRGKYQFTYETWASVGGSGDPAAAPEAEQDYRAALLYASSGSSPWPVCGQ
jgi:hypothetical protein